MSLPALIDALAEVLTIVPDVAVHSVPPNTLETERVIVLYERPGDSTVLHHKPLSIEFTDTVFIELHHVIKKDATESVVGEARATHEAVREAMFRSWATTRFNKTATEFLEFRTEIFGPMEYAEAITFGFRIAAVIKHADTYA